ncbi:MAG: anaerobic ribonucleoside-triphosphate reductase activating protein [Desulfovibrionaceae bacterium]|nr:anaerobic ribonucleoside-triphosphate reductase activating protein [Desulfovibrionaceae bacterium]
MAAGGEIWSYVRGLERFSLCDWPGRTCAVVFVGGCNLRCPTCHNFELAWHMERAPRVPDWKLKIFLAERVHWLEGVTVTGGEPTAAPGIAELLWEIHRLGFPVKLDTNGMRPDVVEDLLSQDLVDVFAVDVKGRFEMYPEITGHGVTEARARVCLERVFTLAEAAPDRFFFRQTRIPVLSDQDVETCRGYLPPGFSLTMQNYVPPRRTTNADADHEEGRPFGDLVHGAHSPGHF